MDRQFLAFAALKANPTASARSIRERSDEKILAASIVVQRFRAELDGTLATPEWQNCARRCADELELPTQRQGVSFVQSLLSLPLESKRELAKRVIESSDRLLCRRSASNLLSTWKQPVALNSSASLSILQWTDIKRRILLKMASGYQAYKSAQSLLFSTYEPIARQAAEEVCFDSNKLDDCAQEGACGLIQAIDRIEPGRAFTSYAFQWTRRRIRNFLMKNCLPISAPINLISKASLEGASADASSAEARELALTLQAIREPSIEFSDTLSDRKSETALCPIEVASRKELVEQLEAALRELTAKQREVLALRFGLLNREAIETLQGIARATGISRQQVTRREQRALSRLAEIVLPLRLELA